MIRQHLQLFIGLSLLLAFPVMPDTWVHPVVFAAILILGIPHGALDHVSFEKTASFNLIRFIINYVLIMLGYLVMWLLSPLHALIVFFAISIYHFGQEYLEELQSGSKPFLFVLWGGFVLGLPFLLHWTETQKYISLITGIAPAPIDEVVQRILVGCFVVSAVGLHVYLRLKKNINTRDFILGSARVFLLTALFTYLPILPSFAIYFIVFHSWNAMSHQYQWLQEQENDFSLRRYILRLLPFTLLAYFGVGILSQVINTNNWEQLAVYLLVFISLLTLPHLLIFHAFYQGKQPIHS